MDIKTVENFERFDTVSLNFQFSSVAILFGLLIYILTRERKRTSIKNDIENKFELSKFLLCLFKHSLGMAKLPITEIFMRFGNLFYLNLYMESPMVVVSNDYETIKHMMNSPEWIHRPKTALAKVRNGGDQYRGILMASGDVWKKTRRFTMKSMTQHGIGKKNHLEYIAHDQMTKFLKNLEKTIEKTNNNVPVRSLFALSTINVIWGIVEGTEFSADDPNIQEIIKASDHMTDVNCYQLIFADILRYFTSTVFPYLTFLKLMKAQETLTRYFTELINTHVLTKQKNELNHNDSQENFIDDFIHKMNSKNKKNNKTEHIFNVDNLRVTLFDIFEAGVDTTSSSLEFATMYLAMHQDVQRKMRKEIKSVIGDDEPSYYSNKTNLPYTQAVIKEIHRMSSIVPLNFRAAISDCYLNDTFIKKGTSATINLYSIHYDEKFWGDPYNFRPERFINTDGCLDSSKLHRVLNFGGGKRVCLGENVANLSIFTFLIGILQKYSVHLAYPNEDIGLDPNSSFTSRVKPFHVNFIPIQQLEK